MKPFKLRICVVLWLAWLLSAACFTTVIFFPLDKAITIVGTGSYSESDATSLKKIAKAYEDKIMDQEAVIAFENDIRHKVLILPVGSSVKIPARYRPPSQSLIMSIAFAGISASIVWVIQYLLTGIVNPKKVFISQD